MKTNGVWQDVDPERLIIRKTFMEHSPYGFTVCCIINISQLWFAEIRAFLLFVMG